jgi:hypothetical protein
LFACKCTRPPMRRCLDRGPPGNGSFEPRDTAGPKRPNLLSSASGELTIGTANTRYMPIALIALHTVALLLEPVGAHVSHEHTSLGRGQGLQAPNLRLFRMPYVALLSPEHPERKSSSSRHRETQILTTTRNNAQPGQISRAMSASPLLPSVMVCPASCLPSDKICPAEIQASDPLKRCGPSPRASPPGLQSRPISPRKPI